jgi:hypothetical protein
MVSWQHATPEEIDMGLDQFARQLIVTLTYELSACTDGQPDHKARLAALREGRALLTSILPRLSEEERKEFGKALSQELSDRLPKIIEEEERLLKLSRSTPP